MKTITIFAIIFCFSFLSHSQEVPLIKVGEKKLGVSKLNINVEVIGNIVTTTYDMQFYNPTNSILEGELIFPLGENQSVSRFALDVNGKIREAVVVEKEQGRIAFEAVVRRRVDPALLEKGTGNNYRARIYPIPAKGYKQVIIAYEEELQFTNDKHSFKLSQDFKNELENYMLSIVVFNQYSAPILDSKSLKRTPLKQVDSQYVFKFEKENYLPDSEIIITIPQDSKPKVSLFEDYLYIYQTLKNDPVIKKNPEKIKLLWDVSYSMKDRNFEKETQFLDAYFKRFDNVEIELQLFSDIIILNKKLSIVDGNWESLKHILKNSVYDGGTSYKSVLENSTFSGETLLFSDGMYSLSNLPKTARNKLYIINSNKKANHDGNNQLATSSGGNYINLEALNISEAIQKITTNPLQFLGYTTLGPSLELYPMPGATVYKDFSISAKGAVAGQQIELQFGYDKTVTESVRIYAPAQKSGTDQIASIWAKQKVKHLQNESELNRDKIVILGKKYGIITDHTSLIVLEDVYDYVKYDITPPVELLDEFLRIKEKKVKIAVSSNNEINSESIEPSPQNTIDTPIGSQITISGSVVDNTGLPLPGVSVIVSGTTNGTQTDFDGNFRINASTGQDLVFSYVGFQTLETTIMGQQRINIAMVEDSSVLEEVVVTAAGVSRESKSVGYSVARINAASLDNSGETDLTRILNGKVAGVQVTSQNGMTGSTNQVTIRGINSFVGDNSPLYIIDGVPFSTTTNSAGSFIDGNMGSSRSLDIDPNNIDNIQVLKGLAATTIYGSEGRNGVILITTKTASLSNTGRSNYSEQQDYMRRENRRKRIDLSNQKTLDEIEFTTPYLEELKEIKNKHDLYKKYLKQRNKYAHLPAYFIDVYDYMKAYDVDLANRILSNIAEIDSDNYELLKAFAYKLEEQNNYPLAVFIYRQILKLRSEDSQSYRDLALALQETGEYQEAVDLLNSIAKGAIYNGNQRRKFEGMKSITTNEIRNIIHTENDTFKMDELPQRVTTNYDMDLRIVVDWNHNDTDIDLHVIDPNLEECGYNYTKTRTGGEISKDMTQGFGPEEFKQKFANKGSYYVLVNYFGDRYQKIENPTFLKVTIYRNYGRKNQDKEIKVLRLTGKNRKQLLKRISVI